MSTEQPQPHTSSGLSTRELALAAAPLVLLLPFIGSAFRIDDPLFLWMARQIQAHPGDPYGFTLNWYGWVDPMSQVLQNPPLAAYYLALAAGLLGWSEAALHLAFLFPALAAALGVYCLARRMCRNAVLATWLSVLSPAFFVSSLTVMSDITMFALWMWALNLWLDGEERNSPGRLAAAALLVGLAALTKYFAIALVPLLLAYTLARRRRLGAWAAYLLIPVATLAAYQWWTAQLYGSGMFLNAVSYASTYGHAHGRFTALGTAVSFAFLGGCAAALLLFAPKLWEPRWLLGGLALAGAVSAAIYHSGALNSFAHLRITPGNLWLLSAQTALWAVAGASLAALVALNLRRGADRTAGVEAESLLLALWAGGTFLFAGYLNWSMNGRSLLPLVAPAALLIVRRLESRAGDGQSLMQSSAVPVALSALLAVLLAQADARFADTSREAARYITKKYDPARRSLWFLGHWGFQYYMELLDARPIDTKSPTAFAPDDVLAIPSVNSNVGSGEPPSWGAYLEFVDIPGSRWLSTTGYGAGFYSDEYGPIPFAFSDVPKERFAIVGVRPELKGK